MISAEEKKRKRNRKTKNQGETIFTKVYENPYLASSVRRYRPCQALVVTNKNRHFIIQHRDLLNVDDDME